MNKLIIVFTFVFLLPFAAHSQELIDLEDPPKFQLAVKGNIGTSWLTFPKAFLVDPEDVNNVWSVAPASNSFCGAVGLQGIYFLGKNWRFLPEIGLSYLSGEVQIAQLEASRASRELQSYVRLNVPLHFAVISNDNFWFAFGPTVFFTLHDNKGFDKAVKELTQVAKVDSDIPVGVALSIIAAIKLTKRMYVDLRFEFDQIKHFRYNNSTETYEVRSAMQNISIGIGYRLWHKK